MIEKELGMVQQKTETVRATVRCRVCGHEWVPRTDEPPLRCARCKSAAWMRGPRQKKGETI